MDGLVEWTWGEEEGMWTGMRMRRAVVTIVVVLVLVLNMVELERAVVKPQRAQKCA
jgi:hypothetical protein